MASGQTTNFGLNQWAAEDKVIRTEFNEDNAKIDAALSTMPKFITGSYVGTGTQEVIHYAIGAQPKMLVLGISNYVGGGNWVTYAIAFDNMNIINYTSGGSASLGEAAPITLQEDGFTIDHGTWDAIRGLNVEGKTVCYWALC